MRCGATKETQRPCGRRPSLKTVHPLGRSPVIEDEGRRIAETGRDRRISAWRKRRQARVHSARRDAVLLYRHFLHYAEGSMMPPLLALLVVNRLGLLGKPAKASVQELMDDHLDWLEAELSTRTGSRATSSRPRTS